MPDFKITRNDRPLDEFVEDPLGLSLYAEALTDFIKKCETPMAVGIQGGWGVGKTSLLHMITHKLGSSTKKYPTIYFNTWKYAQLDHRDQLMVAMLHDIVRSIETLDFVGDDTAQQARDLIERVGRFSADVANQWFTEKYGVDMKAAAAESASAETGPPSFMEGIHQMMRYRTDFENLVKEALSEAASSGDRSSRLVIMIDDLDRIEPARAVNLLSAMKNFLDVPGCVFLLAVDYTVIQRGIKDKLGKEEQRQYGKSYFDKIIQVPFNMPVSSYRVDDYIMALLGWHKEKGRDRYKKTQDGNDDLYMRSQQSLRGVTARSIERFARLTVGQNPRSIKRTINYLRLLVMIFEKNTADASLKESFRSPDDERIWQDLYLELLFGFACIQLTYPEVFDVFVSRPVPQTITDLSDPAYIRELPEANRLAERVQDEHEAIENVAKAFQQIQSALTGGTSAKVTTEEFKPAWNILRFSNLAGDRVGETDSLWNKIKEDVESAADEAGCSDDEKNRLKRAIDLLARSSWDNPVHIGAGNRGEQFVDLTWDGEVIGAIRHVKTEPLHLYVNIDSDALVEKLGEASVAASYVVSAPESHRGTGDSRVRLLKLLEDNKRVQVLDEIRSAVVDHVKS